MREGGSRGHWGGKRAEHLGGGAVEGRDDEAVVVHVQNQVLAHDGEPDDSDVGRHFVAVLRAYEFDTRGRPPPGRFTRRAVGPFYLGVRPPPIGYSTFNRL